MLFSQDLEPEPDLDNEVNLNIQVNECDYPRYVKSGLLYKQSIEKTKHFIYKNKYRAHRDQGRYPDHVTVVPKKSYQRQRPWWYSVHQCLDVKCPIHPEKQKLTDITEVTYHNKLGETNKTKKIAETKDKKTQDDSNTTIDTESIVDIQRRHGINDSKVKNKQKATSGFICSYLKENVDINGYPFYKRSIECFNASSNRHNLGLKNTDLTSGSWHDPFCEDCERKDLHYKTLSNIGMYVDSAEAIGDDDMTEALLVANDIDLSDTFYKYRFVFDPDYVLMKKDLDGDMLTLNKHNKLQQGTDMLDHGAGARLFRNSQQQSNSTCSSSLQSSHDTKRTDVFIKTDQNATNKECVDQKPYRSKTHTPIQQHDVRSSNSPKSLTPVNNRCDTLQYSTRHPTQTYSPYMIMPLSPFSPCSGRTPSPYFRSTTQYQSPGTYWSKYQPHITPQGSLPYTPTCLPYWQTRSTPPNQQYALQTGHTPCGNKYSTQFYYQSNTDTPHTPFLNGQLYQGHTAPANASPNTTFSTNYIGHPTLLSYYPWHSLYNPTQYGQRTYGNTTLKTSQFGYNRENNGYGHTYDDYDVEDPLGLRESNRRGNDTKVLRCNSDDMHRRSNSSQNDYTQGHNETIGYSGRCSRSPTRQRSSSLERHRNSHYKERVESRKRKRSRSLSVSRTKRSKSRYDTKIQTPSYTHASRDSSSDRYKTRSRSDKRESARHRPGNHSRDSKTESSRANGSNSQSNHSRGSCSKSSLKQSQELSQKSNTREGNSKSHKQKQTKPPSRERSLKSRRIASTVAVVERQSKSKSHVDRKRNTHK